MDTTLVIFKKNGERKDIHLNGESTIIGRRPDCNIRVLKSAVSRQHCKLICENGEITVTDLNSSNGTFVNQKKIQEPTKVTPGDVLSLAGIDFTLMVDGTPKDVVPPPPENK